jgi:hypothetical protein
MNTSSSHNLLADIYQVHLRPGPGFVLFCTMLAIPLLSIFLYTVSMKASLFNYSATGAYREQTASGELTPSRSGDMRGWLVSDQRMPRRDEGADGNCAVSSRFPPAILQWCELITRYANKRGLPPDLVAALIWQESGGDPLAYSRSGAVGLMQVMPRDGLAASYTCSSGPCFSSRPTIQELKDPEYNIAYGTKLLSGLLGRHGDVREALKFYGPKDVGYYYADKVFGLFRRYGEHSS